MRKIRKTYVVACTADVTQLNIQKCKSYKFDKILGKPVSNEELKNILENNLS